MLWWCWCCRGGGKGYKGGRGAGEGEATEPREGKGEEALVCASSAIRMSLAKSLERMFQPAIEWAAKSYQAALATRLKKYGKGPSLLVAHLLRRGNSAAAVREESQAYAQHAALSARSRGCEWPTNQSSSDRNANISWFSLVLCVPEAVVAPESERIFAPFPRSCESVCEEREYGSVA